MREYFEDHLGSNEGKKSTGKSSTEKKVAGKKSTEKPLIISHITKPAKPSPLSLEQQAQEQEYTQELTEQIA
jgi:hypothetical protein